MTADWARLPYDAAGDASRAASSTRCAASTASSTTSRRSRRPRSSGSRRGALRPSSTSTSTRSTRCSTAPSRSTSCFRARKPLGMPAVAMTDHGNLFGAVEFYEKARDAGVQADHRLRGLRRRRLALRQEAGARRRSEAARQQPPDAARDEREGLPQPDPPGLAGLPRRLLLQAAHRPGAAARAQRGPDRACRAASSGEVNRAIAAQRHRARLRAWRGVRGDLRAIATTSRSRTTASRRRTW